MIITEKQKGNTRKLYNFARGKNLQIVASHPAYFLNQEDYLLHKTVSAIRLNKSIENLANEDIIDKEYFL